MYKITKRSITIDDFLKLKNFPPFKKMRSNGKTLNLATIFACTGPTLGRQMKGAGFSEHDCDLTIETFNLENAYNTALRTTKDKTPLELKYIIVGNKLRELFFQTYPGLLDRVNREQQFAMKHGYVRTWTGPVRHFPEFRYMKRNINGNLIGVDQKLYSKMFAGMKNEASNTSIQTAEVYQAMPDCTATNVLLKEWGLKSRLYNYVHDSLSLYVYKPEARLIYALLNRLSLEHREPYYDLRMYIDVIEADLTNPEHYYDKGKEINIENYDLDEELTSWNAEHGTNLVYKELIPK